MRNCTNCYNSLMCYMLNRDVYEKVKREYREDGTCSCLQWEDDSVDWEEDNAD